MLYSFLARRDQDRQVLMETFLWEAVLELGLLEFPENTHSLVYSRANSMTLESGEQRFGGGFYLLLSLCY